MHRKSKLQYWWAERQPYKRKNFYLQCHDRNAKNPIWWIVLTPNWTLGESDSRYKNSNWIHFVGKVLLSRNFHVWELEVFQNRKVDFEGFFCDLVFLAPDFGWNWCYLKMGGPLNVTGGYIGHQLLRDCSMNLELKAILCSAFCSFSMSRFWNYRASFISWWWNKFYPQPGTNTFASD